MPTLVKPGTIPIPIVILDYGLTGAGKSSLPLRAKNRFGEIYVLDAEHQAQHCQGSAYGEFMYDTVDTAAQAETHIAKLAAGDKAYHVNGIQPRVLVIDTATVLKDEAENKVYDNKTKGAEVVVIFDPGMWAQAKRPIRFMMQQIQRSSSQFDVVYIIARAKPEMVGSGNNAQYTGKNIPDLPRGSDYTPNLIVEVNMDHTVTVKKTKPSLEAQFKEGTNLTFEKFYDALDVVLQRKGIIETEAQSKTRLVAELKEYYPEGGAAVAAAMRQEPAIVFSVAKYDGVKAELIRRAALAELEKLAGIPPPNAQPAPEST